MNLLADRLLININIDTSNSEIYDYTLEPDYDRPKNYKTSAGYKAVVDIEWNDYLILVIENGKTVGRRYEAF